MENHKVDETTPREKEDASQERYNSKLQATVNNNSIIVDCVSTKFDDTDDEITVDESSCSNIQQTVLEEKEVLSNLPVNLLAYLEGSPLLRNCLPSVNLYQPIQKTQLLFSEMPNCLYVKAFFRACNLKHDLIQKANAEHIGPSGELPVLKFGKSIVSGAEKIIEFLEKKGISLTSSVDETNDAELNAYMSLVKMTLGNAEDFVTWRDPEIFAKLTWSRFCSAYPWPLGQYLIRKKQKKVQNKLKTMDWFSKTFEDVCEEIDTCFKALSNKLDDHYFFGKKATLLDLLVFAHTYTIMMNDLPKPQFVGILLQYPKLVKHCYRVLESYFQDELSTSNQFAELVHTLSV